MSVSPETDPDGVVDRDTSSEVHENVRESAEGVEEVAAGGDTAAGLIGNGNITDPRYVRQTK
jgi:hypothetical protein